MQPDIFDPVYVPCHNAQILLTINAIHQRKNSETEEITLLDIKIVRQRVLVDLEKIWGPQGYDWWMKTEIVLDSCRDQSNYKKNEENLIHEWLFSITRQDSICITTLNIIQFTFDIQFQNLDSNKYQSIINCKASAVQYSKISLSILEWICSNLFFLRINFNWYFPNCAVVTAGDYPRIPEIIKLNRGRIMW